MFWRSVRIFFVIVILLLSSVALASGCDFRPESCAAFKRLKIAPVTKTEEIGRFSFVYQNRYKKIKPDIKDFNLVLKAGEADPMSGSITVDAMRINVSVRKVATIVEGVWVGASIISLEESGESLFETDQWDDPSYFAYTLAVVPSTELSSTFLENWMSEEVKNKPFILKVGNSRIHHLYLQSNMIDSIIRSEMNYNSVPSEKVPDDVYLHPFLTYPPKSILLNGATLMRSGDVAAGRFTYKTSAVGERKKTNLVHPILGQAWRTLTGFQFDLPTGYTWDFYYEMPPEASVQPYETSKQDFACYAPPSRNAEEYEPTVVGKDADFSEFVFNGKKTGFFVAKRESGIFKDLYSEYKVLADEYFKADTKRRSKNRYVAMPLDEVFGKKLDEAEFERLTPAIFWKTPFGWYINCRNQLVRLPELGVDGGEN